MLGQCHSCLELVYVYLIEHEGAAGKGVQRLSYEPYVGIVLTV